MLPDRVQSALLKLGLDVQSVPWTLHAGFSGADIYRVGDLAIKKHPLDFCQRLQVIHEAQQAWASSCPWVPGLVQWPSPVGPMSRMSRTVLLDQDACWECMDWLPGCSLKSNQLVTLGTIRSVGFSLGLLHRTALTWNATLGKAGQADQRMSQRLELLEQAVRTRFQSSWMNLELWSRDDRRSAVDLELAGLLERALKVADCQASGLVQPFTALTRRAGLKHWGHGDAWRENWLFEADHVVGLVDFSQAGVRWPGFDFARAIGSMVQSQVDGWQEAWGSYTEALGQPSFTLGDVQLMHGVSTVLTLAGYLDRLSLGLVREDRAAGRLREVCRQVLDWPG